MAESSGNPFGGLDLLSSAVVLLDGELAIRYLNPAAEDLLAISSKVFVGCPLAGIIECPPGLLTALDSAPPIHVALGRRRQAATTQARG